ncbi:MAG: Holliday junction resolvase RuvX [Epsilonproteobacteria bacterium]|nr:Holliday junction resolvase RuvX [Campylobacterota bacterium]
MNYLAVDVGLKRIGLAYSPDGKIVTPLPAILRKNRNQAARDLKNVIIKWDIDKLIVGIPYGGSSEEEMTRRIKHFLSLVAFDKEIVFEDESGTSLEAKELLKGEMRSIKDGRIDSIAAMIILKRHLKII